MYPNLNAELARHRINYRALMKIWGVTDRTVRSKLKGVTPITIKEAFLVKQILFPDLSLDYLFDITDK